MLRPQNCTKVIIAVGGFGTRWLPLSKAIEKCMLPVGNRPVIDYIVQDCIKAGITDIIFVVSEASAQIRQFYGSNTALEEYLDAKGKHTVANELRALATKARFTFVVQDKNQPYGTSVPINLCREYIRKGETFAVVFGDQFFYHQDGVSEMAALLSRATGAGTNAAMLGVTVPHEEVVNYGIIACHEENGVMLYDHIVERPATPADAPSNLNNASFFVFDDSILPYVAANVAQNIQGERYLTDALNSYNQDGHSIAVFTATGEYLDCGTPTSWLHANNRVLANPQPVV